MPDAGTERRPTVSVVVPGQGNRPVELSGCLDSVRGQCGVTTEIFCVGNGWMPSQHISFYRFNARNRCGWLAATCVSC